MKLRDIFGMQNQPMQDTFIEKPSSAANETLEDYTLRYAPYSFRRWSPKVVAITALEVLHIWQTFRLVLALV